MKPNRTPHRWRNRLLGAAVGAIALINSIAWMQAWSMTHFIENAQRTAQPEKLSVLTN
jgi:hypothetical protein